MESLYICRIPDQILLPFQNLPASQIHILRRYAPLTEFRLVLLLAVFRNFFRVGSPGGHHAPLRVPGLPRLIPAPAHIRTADADACLRLKTPDHFIVPFPVINLTLSIGPFPAGSVKPHRKNFPVILQKLLKLSHKIIVILSAASIKRVVPVPGREIHAKGKPLLPAGIGDFPYHVPPAVFVRTQRNAVARVSAGPQAEAVMMLTGQDQSPHARIFGRPGPLPGIQPGGIKDFRAFRSVPPFLIRKGVDRKMNKSVKF